MLLNLCLLCLSQATSAPHNYTPPPPPPSPLPSPPPPLLPPPPPKGTSPVLPPSILPPCKCSISLKTIGACGLVLRGIAVGFAERICCNGLKKLSYSDVSSCICFVFRSNIGKSSKLKLTIDEAKKVIAVACNL
ncbi:hypothetical protein LIER_31565 [Lithospermum erythrorhizon]|uniref:Hydrophobic seed protein domain-containing protein n=1 Tax=Lithospermum erythrorhizon TaxID=34254 RepID=A0AAV3RVC6_LITER